MWGLTAREAFLFVQSFADQRLDRVRGLHARGFPRRNGCDHVGVVDFAERYDHAVVSLRVISLRYGRACMRLPLRPFGAFYCFHSLFVAGGFPPALLSLLRAFDIGPQQPPDVLGRVGRALFGLFTQDFL